MAVVAVILIPAAVVIASRLSPVRPTIEPRQNQIQLACQDVLDLRDDYFARTISVEMREAIDRHLKSCPYCARKYQAVEK